MGGGGGSGGSGDDADVNDMRRAGGAGPGAMVDRRRTNGFGEVSGALDAGSKSNGFCQSSTGPAASGAPVRGGESGVANNMNRVAGDMGPGVANSNGFSSRAATAAAAAAGNATGVTGTTA